jgi:hypothetical protein
LFHPSANKLDHAKAVGCADPFVDNRVHALSHEMKPKSTRTKFARGEAFERAGFGLCAAIHQQNFQAVLIRLRAVYLAESNFDIAARFTGVGVANNVGNGLIQGKCDGAAIFFSKTDGACNGRYGASHAAQDFRITVELKSQKELPPGQGPNLRGAIVSKQVKDRHWQGRIAKTVARGEQKWSEAKA